MSQPITYVKMEVLVAFPERLDESVAREKAVRRLNDGLTQDNILSTSIEYESVKETNETEEPEAEETNRMRPILWRGGLDHAEAKGVVWMEHGAYGFEIFVQGASLDENDQEQPIARLDFYPASPNGREHYKGVVAQLILDDPRNADEMLAVFHLCADQTKQIVP